MQFSVPDATCSLVPAIFLIFIGRGYFYGDSCRKNARVTVKITRSLYLRRRTNSLEGAQSALHSLLEINLNINFKAQNCETKTDTNPIPDPYRYRRCCPPDPNARIQKFYTLYQNTTKEFT